MEIVRDKLDIFCSKLLVQVTQCPIFLAETYLKVWPRSMANCAKEMLHVSLFRKDITTLDISRLVIRLVLSGDREGGRQGGGWEASREEGGSIKWTGNCTSEAKQHQMQNNLIQILYKNRTLIVGIICFISSCSNNLTTTGAVVN